MKKLEWIEHPGNPSKALAIHLAHIRREKMIIARTAKDLEKCLSMDSTDIEAALRGIKKKFIRHPGNGVFEKAAHAKVALLKLAQKTDELWDAIQELGPGSFTVLNRNSEHSGLNQDAEPFNLPDWEGVLEEDPIREEDGSPRSLWLTRLASLGELARLKAKWIEERTGKGGRNSFEVHLHGSPDEWLAKACIEFAETHECHSQAVVLKMVQAVKVSSGCELKGKYEGRKAVRKLAQTSKNERAV